MALLALPPARNMDELTLLKDVLLHKIILGYDDRGTELPDSNRYE